MKRFFLEKEIRMSIPEFLSYTRGELTLREIKKNRDVENIFLRLYNNRRTRRFIITFLAGFLFVESNVLGVNLEPVNGAGRTLLNIVQTFGYWACLVMSVVEVAKSLVNGDTRGISRIIIKYLIGFASFYALPWMFDLIKSFFEGGI